MTVAEVLERWPELEPVLVAQAPAFRKLRNPVLRRTVARVATLEQAAGIAGLSPRALVVALRRAVGQPVDGLDEDRAARGARASETTPDAGETAPPAWLETSRIVRTIDADALLDAGEVPLHAAFAAARSLGPGDVLEVVASFRPIPLVENFEKQGLACSLRSGPDGRFHLYATRAPRRPWRARPG